MNGATEHQVHATCVALAGRGVLLRGPSGAGKSDLALRLIDVAGGVLVADDRVDLIRRGGHLMAGPPADLAGLLEVRGVGILKLPFLAEAPVHLVVDLVSPEIVERLPERTAETVMDVSLAYVRLAAFEASAPAKVRLAVAAAVGDGIEWAEPEQGASAAKADRP